MGFPRKLKQMMLFVNGVWVAENVSMTLPKFTRKTEEYRGGAMNRPVKVDMGGEAIECEWSCAGMVREVLRSHGSTTLGSEQLRFVGVLENDDTGEVTRVEVVMRGRHNEIDRGESKSGEDTEMKMKTDCAFYQESWDGTEEVYIDPFAMIERFGGVDRMAAQRAALGLI